MLLFSSPMLLVILPFVGVLGLWALWRGKHGVQKVSSTRLWEGLVDSAAGGKKRAIDPVWLLVFLAAMLAALAVSGPAWRFGAGDGQTAPHMAWSMRSIGDGAPELFIRIEQPEKLPQPLIVNYVPGEMEFPWPKDLKYRGEQLSAERLDEGAIVHPSVSTDDGKISVRLEGGTKIMAAATFTRPARPPFAMLTQTSSAIDPALYRVFAVNPAVRPNDPRVSPQMLLVNDPHFDTAGIAPDTLIIASPTTPLPGINLTASFTPANRTPAAVNLPLFIHLDKVHINTAQGATLSPEWTILATIDNGPLLAMRRLAGQGPTLLWLACQPATQSDWPLDSSFPLCFADLLARTFPTSSASGGAIHDWAVNTSVANIPSQLGATMQLSPALAVATMVLLLLPMVLLIRRARPIGPLSSPVGKR